MIPHFVQNVSLTAFSILSGPDKHVLNYPPEGSPPSRHLRPHLGCTVVVLFFIFYFRILLYPLRHSKARAWPDKETFRSLLWRPL